MAKDRGFLRRRIRQAGMLGLLVLGGAVVAYGVWFSPVDVATEPAKRGQIIAEVLGTGTLEARVRVTISPKIAGRISEILADQGDRVSQGATLVRLDDEELQQQVAIARADLDAAQAKVERLISDRRRAESVHDHEQNRHRRARGLYARKAASSEELDSATEALLVAEAGLSSAEAALVEGRKELVAVEEALKFQQARLADATIKAPFDGLIVRRHRDPGDVAVSGSPVLSLIDTKEMWVSAWVDETEMARLRDGQPARVVFRSEPSRSFQGQVARLGREADRETREFIVDVQSLELPENWAVGQRAEVYIEVDRRDSSLLIPARSVVWRGESPGVFVESNGRAAWRPIEVGLRSADRVEVIQGLDEGVAVVVPSLSETTLTEGRRLRSL